MPQDGPIDWGSPGNPRTSGAPWNKPLPRFTGKWSVKVKHPRSVLVHQQQAAATAAALKPRKPAPKGQKAKK